MRKLSLYIMLLAMIRASLPVAAPGQIAPAQPKRTAPQPVPPEPQSPPATAPVAPLLGDEQKAFELSQRAQQISQSLKRALGPREQLFDPAYRDSIRPQVVPILKESLALADEFAAAGGQGAAIAVRIRYDAESMLAVFDDADTIRQLESRANARRGAVSILARQALIFATWIKANGAPGGQHQALDGVEALAGEAPANDDITQLLVTLLEASPANADVRDRMMRILSTRLTGPMAKQVSERIAARQTRAALEGKPLLILGVRFNREMFSTRAWQGRVVMVVFWSSASPACREQVPRWVRLFEAYNKEGLEIIGVSCDTNAQDLLRFKASHPKMAWPELFDTEQPGWHALARELGVTDLPTIMLIDKNGVCRSTDAGADLEPQIRKLLSE
jgi:thiol-disulfide isomerase/thioredoxin